MPAQYPPHANVTVAADRQMWTKLAGEVVIIGLDDGYYYRLEGVAVRIWELLQSRQRVSAVVDRMVAEYQVAPATAEADLQAFLSDLATHRLIDVDVPDRG